MAELYRPPHGSMELKVKLVCDAVSIHDEVANRRALYMVGNSINNPKFLLWFMNKHRYITLIEYLTPPTKQLLQYKTKNGAVVREMNHKKQADINLASCVALTCLSNKLNDQGRLRLVAADIIPGLLLCYAMSTDDRQDVKNAALGCLGVYGVNVGHRQPTYADASTDNDQFFNYKAPTFTKKQIGRRRLEDEHLKRHLSP